MSNLDLPKVMELGVGINLCEIPAGQTTTKQLMYINHQTKLQYHSLII